MQIEPTFVVDIVSNVKVDILASSAGVTKGKGECCGECHIVLIILTDSKRRGPHPGQTGVGILRRFEAILEMR